jgi:hypothetical protein
MHRMGEAGAVLLDAVQSQTAGKDIHETDHPSVVGIRQVFDVNFRSGRGLDDGKLHGQKPFTQLLLIRLDQLRADDLCQAQ